VWSKKQYAMREGKGCPLASKGCERREVPKDEKGPVLWEKFFSTGWATCPGKALGQLAAVDEFVDHVLNDRSQVPIRGVICLMVLGEVVEVIIKALPEG